MVSKVQLIVMIFYILFIFYYYSTLKECMKMQFHIQSASASLCWLKGLSVLAERRHGKCEKNAFLFVYQNTASLKPFHCVLPDHVLLTRQERQHLTCFKQIATSGDKLLHCERNVPVDRQNFASFFFEFHIQSRADCDRLKKDNTL